MPQTNLMRLVPEHRTIVAAIREMFPTASDDDLIDTIAGESNFQDALLVVLRNALEREAHAAALADLIEKMTTRKRRLENGAKSIRNAVLEAMTEAEMWGIKAADMSVSIGEGKPKVIIVSAADLPDEFCRLSREPNKIDIAKALAEDKPVSGAMFGNPQPFLTIHRG